MHFFLILNTAVIKLLLIRRYLVDWRILLEIYLHHAHSKNNEILIAEEVTDFLPTAFKSIVCLNAYTHHAYPQTKIIVDYASEQYFRFQSLLASAFRVFPAGAAYTCTSLLFFPTWTSSQTIVPNPVRQLSSSLELEAISGAAFPTAPHLHCNSAYHCDTTVTKVTMIYFY